MTLTKSIDTVVEDLYRLLENGKVVEADSVKELASALAETIAKRLVHDERKPHIRMSMIGMPLRKFWYTMKEPEKEVFSGKQLLNFLYGDILEDIVLWLVKESGHSVTDRQKKVTVDGVDGSIDAIIDGQLVDVKSASPKSYIKFESGKLADNDSFGYLGQLAGYNEVLKTITPSFLAINKATADVCLYQPDVDFDLPSATQLIADKKKAIDSDVPPDIKCYKDKAEGASGNRVLHTNCNYCVHKFKCWDGLRQFNYSTGPKFFTVVEKEPKVEEVLTTIKDMK